jgi:hypothetical protein
MCHRRVVILRTPLSLTSQPVLSMSQSDLTSQFDSSRAGRLLSILEPALHAPHHHSSRPKTEALSSAKFHTHLSPFTCPSSTPRKKKIKIPSLTQPTIPASASNPAEDSPTGRRAVVTLHAKASSEHSSRKTPRTGGLEGSTSSKNGVCGSSARILGHGLHPGIAQFWNLMQEPSHGALIFDAALGFCWWGGVPPVEKKFVAVVDDVVFV